MTYSTLMVQLQLGRPHASLLALTDDLATQFGAGVIGVVACQPLQISYGEIYVSGSVIQADFDDLTKEIADAEVEFHAALGAGSRSLGWRRSITYSPLCDFVAQEARGADLVITEVTPRSFLTETRVMSIGDLVMRAGRPVLIVPEGKAALDLNLALVAWKDTREARRAVVDALPLLKKARHVTLLTLAAAADAADARAQLGDVAAWLDRHGIAAEIVVHESTGDDASELSRYATVHGVDLIVAGAYGHSRAREWILGGVTRDLLLCPDRCALVSH